MEKSSNREVEVLGSNPSVCVSSYIEACIYIYGVVESKYLVVQATLVFFQMEIKDSALQYVMTMQLFKKKK